MSDLNILNWQRGHILADAMLLVASETERKTYQTLNRQSPRLQLFTEAMKALGNSEKFHAVAESTAASDTKIYLETRDILRDRVIDAVYSQKAKALGYAQPRGASDSPIEVPIDLWGGKINWDKSEVSNNGLTVTAVRIVWGPASTQPPAPAPAPAPIPISKPAVKRKGRPPLAPHIIEALDALDAAGFIDYGIPLKSFVPTISAWIINNHPDAMGRKTGIDYSTIQKAIGIEFSKRRKNR